MASRFAHRTFFLFVTFSILLSCFPKEEPTPSYWYKLRIQNDYDFQGYITAYKMGQKGFTDNCELERHFSNIGSNSSATMDLYYWSSCSNGQILMTLYNVDSAHAIIEERYITDGSTSVTFP